MKDVINGRVVSLEAGAAMVVTDLHGDWSAYCRYRDHFLDLQARGQAHYLIFTGDLIHSDGPPQADRSLDIVLDVLGLQESLGSQVIYLLGNHELPHIYGISLQRGDHSYTPGFEAALGRHRANVCALFDHLPFYARTRAGVSICHAGASPTASRLFDFSHRKILDQAAAALPPDQRPLLRAELARQHNISYQDLARYYLAVSGPDDPRYDDLLIGAVAQTDPAFESLWQALFTLNERDYGDAYALILQKMLDELSADFCPQTVLVSGHLACQGGYTLVGQRQLRLASGAHAYPRRSARYLLFDTARPVRQAQDLARGLGSVFAR